MELVIIVALVVFLLLIKKHLLKSMDGIGEVGQIKIAQYKNEMLNELGEDYDEVKLTNGLTAFNALSEMKINKQEVKA